MKKANGLLIKSASAVSAVLLLAGTASAQFPGTNGRIIFQSIGGYYNGVDIGTGVFTIKPDGTGMHQFSFPFLNGGSNSQSYSPDGTKIAYEAESSPGSGISNIYVKNADDTGTPIHVSTGTIYDRHPRWSPDGSKIVFVRNLASGTEIFVANADGSGGEVRRTTHGVTGSGDFPTFTPDGTKIVFAGGGAAISRVDATGAADANVTAILNSGSASVFDGLDISPDGNTVVFSNTDSSTTGSIRTVPYAGGSVTTLVDNSDGTYKFYPSYSPDGTKIAFIRSHSSSSLGYMDRIQTYTVSGGALADMYVSGPGGSSQSGGFLYSLFWGTNNSTLSNNIGQDSFNDTNDTGLPNTASTFFKNPSNWIPTLLAGVSILGLAIYSRKWFKREFANKKH